MLKVVISGKMNAEKVQDTLQKELDTWVKGVQKDHPQLKEAFGKKLITIRVELIILKSEDMTIISEDLVDEPRLNYVKLVQKAGQFFDSVSLTVNELSLTNSNGQSSATGADNKYVSWSLSELGLSRQVINCLESDGITIAGELIARTANELLEIRNFGKRSLYEVSTKLAEKGLKLKDD